jgi:hypothetical protein
MDWNEVTGDDALLSLVREGREKSEQGSESLGRRRRNIKESMFVNYESVCVDRPYSAGKPVKIDFAGGDADIYQTQPGELKNSLLEWEDD